MANIKKVIVCCKTADDLNNMRIKNFDIFDSLKDVNMDLQWYYMVSKVRIDYMQAIPSNYAGFTAFIDRLKQALKDGELEGTNKHITRHYQDCNIIGCYGLCNTASLNVYDIDPCGDWVIAGLNNYKPYQYKLYINNKGAYFNFGKNRYYLNNFEKMRGVI